MDTISKGSVKRKVFPKGQIVIPVALRKKYHIEVGGHVDIIPQADGILLRSVAQKKTVESLTDSLYGIFGKYTKGKENLKKAEISRETEAGFLEGWKEGSITGLLMIF